MSHKSVPQQCPTRVSYKSVPQEFPTRVSHKSVPQECPVRVSHKSFLQECPTRVSYKSVIWTYVAFRTCLHSGSWAPSCFLCRSSSVCPPTFICSTRRSGPHDRIRRPNDSRRRRPRPPGWPTTAKRTPNSMVKSIPKMNWAKSSGTDCDVLETSLGSKRGAVTRLVWLRSGTENERRTCRCT